MNKRSTRRRERGGASNIVEDDVVEKNMVVEKVHVAKDEPILESPCIIHYSSVMRTMLLDNYEMKW